MVAISCVLPLPSGKGTCSTSTANTRVVQTIAMDLLRQLVQDALQVFGQRAREFHSPFLGRVRERQLCGVKKRTCEMGDGAQIAGNASMYAAIERIAHHRVPDGTEVDANLMRATCVNCDVRERQYDAEFFRLDDPRHCLTAAPCFRRHFLPVYRVAADRRVDAASRLHLSPDERDVLFFDFTIAKLPGEFFVGG